MPDRLLLELVDFLKTITIVPGTHMHRLLLNLDTLMIKCMLYVLTSIDKLYELVNPNKKTLIKMGENFVRMVGHATIRHLKIRGMHGQQPQPHKQVENAQSIIDTLSQECPHVFPLDTSSMNSSPNTSFYPTFQLIQIPKFTHRTKHLFDLPQSMIESHAHLVMKLINDAQSGKSSAREMEVNVNDVIQDLKSNDMKKQSLLCMIWHAINHIRPYFDPVQKAIKSLITSQLTAIELNTATYRFVNYVLTTCEHVPAVNHSHDMNDDHHHHLLINSICDLICKFVWDYEFIALETCLLALIEQIPHHPHSIAIIKYLLIQNNHLLDRARFYLELDVNHMFYEEDEFYTKHVSYHARYPEHWGLQESSSSSIPLPTQLNQSSSDSSSSSSSTSSTFQDLPCVYGNVCLRMIPIFDLLIRKLIECKSSPSSDLISNVIDHYGMFIGKYHENIVTFLKSILLLYFDRTSDNDFVLDQSTKFKLIELTLHHDYFSEQLYQIMQNSGLDTNEDYTFLRLNYFVKRITLLSNVLPVIQDTDASHISPRDRFNEFPSEFETRLNYFIVELLVLLNSANFLPDLKIAMDAMIESVLMVAATNINMQAADSINGNFNQHVFALAHTVGIVIASLIQPESCQCLLTFVSMYASRSLKNASSHEISKQTQALLTIVHTFFGYATMESLLTIKEFLSASHDLVHHHHQSLTIAQLHFYGRMIGPVVSTLNKCHVLTCYDANGNSSKCFILHEIVLELIKLTCRVKHGHLRNWSEFTFQNASELDGNGVIVGDHDGDGGGDGDDDFDFKMLQEFLDLLDHICHLLYNGPNKRGNPDLDLEKYKREFVDEVCKIGDDGLRKLLLKMIALNSTE
ncbi:hypothetical protein AKO1_012378 [Acrasis kona]|uniref:Uncharacterized protein n=1 Tax=Acrasis kona TaxID=1008807 RepID=A0AAW2YX82_9EUKA